ncbi:hypothetical protein CRG98_002687 [Punica granatum]|uniref:Uncharacterized protein n=1 Tax=Punica granatum TaxID=22663 RepID=A0A2I0L8D5_PUNGR|nr:hypothetical protein CRG98_002687 [Punica granatum]
MRAHNATRLGSVHLPGKARRTYVRRSHYYLFTTRRSRAGKVTEVESEPLGPATRSGLNRPEWVENAREEELGGSNGSGLLLWADESAMGPRETP